MQLATGLWRGANELSVKISDGAVEIKGVVELAGSNAAMLSLAGCEAKGSSLFDRFCHKSA
jgi:hypothetical protein